MTKATRPETDECMSNSNKLLSRLIIVLLSFSLISACSPLQTSEQPTRNQVIHLENGKTIGQTFLSRFDGLEGISIFMKPGEPGDGNIQLSLYSSPETSLQLASSTVPLEKIQSPRYYRFSFPPVQDSTKDDYYLKLDLNGDGTALVARASGNSYLNGSLYLNDAPQDSQLNFRLVHNQVGVIKGLFTEVLMWIIILFVAYILYIIPGWALFDGFFPGWETLNLWQKLGLSAGMSLAIYPIMFLWSNIMGLNGGPLYAWFPTLIASSYLILKQFRKTKKPSLKDLYSISLQSSDFAVIIVIGLIFAVRFWGIRDLDAPMWGDSYQHTMIAQLLVDNNGLFNSWEPYAQLSTFTYHFGFHTLLAIFNWVTNISMPQSTLWVGQTLNALAAISLYPLALRLGRSSWSGVVAVLFAGLLLPMPMFYVNWGRYTQLAGLIILATFVYLSWKSVDAKSFNWSFLVLASVTLGGLALTHYRILVFAVLFLVALFISYSLRGDLRSILLKVIAIASIGGMIFLPWFIKVFSGRIMNIFSKQISSTTTQSISNTQLYNSIGDIAFYLPIYIWILFLGIIIWGLIRREKGVILFTIWWGTLLFITNPQWLNLPGVGAITNFALFISFYFPASLLLGASVGWVLDFIPVARSGNKDTRIILYIVPILIITFLGLLGSRDRVAQIQPGQFALMTRPDENAISWINENLPQGARFLVNSFNAYGGTRVVGSDGGWWLPLLTMRSSTLPPLTYGFEQGITTDYRKVINDLNAEVITKGVTHPDVIDLLKQYDITHIYIGQQQGSVNNYGARIKPEDMLDHPAYTPVYNQDRVWIFQFRESSE